MNIQQMLKTNRLIKNLAAFENFKKHHTSYGLSFSDTKTLLVIDPINDDNSIYTKFMHDNHLEHIKYISLDPDDYSDLKIVNKSQGMIFKEYEALGICHFNINELKLNNRTQKHILSITDSYGPADKTPAVFIGNMLNFSYLIDCPVNDKKIAIQQFIDNLNLFKGFPGTTPVFSSSTNDDRVIMLKTMAKIFPGNSFLKSKIDQQDFNLNFLAMYKEVFPFFDLDKQKFMHLIGSEEYSKLKLMQLFLSLYEASGVH